MENPETLGAGVSPRPAPAAHTSTAAALGLEVALLPSKHPLLFSEAQTDANVSANIAQ